VRDLPREELAHRRARKVRLLEHMVELSKQRNLNLRAKLADPAVDMLGGRRRKITRSVVSGRLGDGLEQRLPFRHGFPLVFF
jgi:hypothetical protein